MKRKILDARLYRSGLSQLRLAGTIFCVLAVLGAGLPCFFAVLQSRQAQALGTVISSPDLRSVTLLLVGVTYLAPVALCLTLFGFLNHRNGSDFYHSIPQTRLCLFASFGAAALTWGYAAILLGMGAAAAVFGAAGMAGSINFAPLPYVLFTDLAGMTLLTAEMLLAMSITGTVVTNLTVCGLLLFLPRFLTTVFAQMLIGRLRFIGTDAFGILGNTLFNIPVSFFLAAFNGTSEKLFSSAGPILYTYVLSAVYLLLAGLLFARRKSESAGRSAPNRPLQHIYRCLIALPSSLIIPYTVLSWDPSEGDFFSHNLYLIITVTVVTLLIYFLFELISTKNPRNLPRAAPVFLAVVAFDVIFGFCAQGAQSWFLHDTPKASEIRSVTFQYFNSDASDTTRTYNQLMVRRAALTDSRLTGQVAQALKETARRVGEQDYDDFEYYVRLKLQSGRVMERKLYATEAEIQTVEAVKQANPQFHAAQTDLPPEAGVKKITLYGLDEESSRKVWRSFRSEYATLTDAQKMQLVGTASSHGPAHAAAADPDGTIANFDVQGAAGLENYQSHYAVSNLTPKTLALLTQTSNQKNGPLLWSRIKRIADGDKVGYGYAVTGHNRNSQTADSKGSAETLAYGEVTNKAAASAGPPAADRQIMQILLRHRGDASVDASRPFAEVSFYRFNGETGYSSTVFLNLSDDEMRQILALHRGVQGK